MKNKSSKFVFGLSCLFLVAISEAKAQPPQQRTPSPNDTLKSPEVLSDKLEWVI